MNSKDNFGKCVLIYAAESGNIKLVEILLEYGAEVNTKDNSGKTALHYVAASENIDIIKGPIIYSIDGRSPSSHKRSFFI